jgi:putative flippase GtrA
MTRRGAACYRPKNCASLRGKAAVRASTTVSVAAIRAELAILMRFASVGLVATLVHLAVSGATLGLAAVSAQVANGAGFAVAFCVSYLGHYHFTFRSDRAHRTSLSRFALVAVTGYAMSALALAALGAVPGLPELARLVLAIGVIPILNYVVSRVWVY